MYRCKNEHLLKQKWIIASISLFIPQKKCTIQQSYYIQTGKRQHLTFCVIKITGRNDNNNPQTPADATNPPFQTPVQRSRNQTRLPRYDIGEERQILHSSDVMDVRHFEKVFIRQITARPTNPFRKSHQQAVKKIWNECRLWSDPALLASCSPNTEEVFLVHKSWSITPRHPEFHVKNLVQWVKEGNELFEFVFLTKNQQK